MARKSGASAARTATVARIGRAAWFFGNAYEAAVGVPQLVAMSNRRGGILASGSPARYFAPVAPAAIGGTAVTLLHASRSGGDRRAIAAAAAALSAALGLSGYLIASINIPLLRGKFDNADQAALISRWHRGNAARLGLLAASEMLMRRVETTAAITD